MQFSVPFSDHACPGLEAKSRDSTRFAAGTPAFHQEAKLFGHRGFQTSVGLFLQTIGQDWNENFSSEGGIRWPVKRLTQRACKALRSISGRAARC